ncbi:MAG: GDP-mannose 4,6-dehydratase [Chlamydiales bacterium]
MKTALITGITGQDGAYLAELLIQKGYRVHGIRRRASTPNTSRIQSLLKNFPNELLLHNADLTDANSLMHVLQLCKPDEIYNLAAQSDVAVSFENPLYSADVNALGTLRILEGMRTLGLESRFYQASTSELFGKVLEVPQKETTPFYPRSPYGVAKLFGYWITVNYREAYNMFACNGILFNHESPKRAESFVTRKITRTLSRILYGMESTLRLGNLNAKRDWGHTRDFVQMQWMILQQDKPEDYVIATGEQHSVREFVELACEELEIEFHWEGSGVNEKGIVDRIDSVYLRPGDVLIEVDPKYFRPAEVETLLGDPSKAKNQLGWIPQIPFRQLVAEMVQEDVNSTEQESCSTSASMLGC